MAAAIYGWDCPLQTFIYPGFKQVAHLTMSVLPLLGEDHLFRCLASAMANTSTKPSGGMPGTATRKGHSLIAGQKSVVMIEELFPSDTLRLLKSLAK